MGRIGPSQETAAEAAGKGLGNLAKFHKEVKKPGDTIKNIQNFAKKQQEENERKKREKEEAAKKSSVAPKEERGFIGRMMDKYVYGKKEQ